MGADPAPVPQRQPPANLRAIPANAITLRDGIQYVVFSAGTGTPALGVDTVDYAETAWNSAGQTVAFELEGESVVDNLNISELLTGMKQGESRRYWVPQKDAYSLDPKHDVVVDLTVQSITHNFDELPDGMHLERGDDTRLQLVQGETRVDLPIWSPRKVQLRDDTVRFTTEGGCGVTNTDDYTLDELHAMIAAGQHDYDRAIALAPKNLAYPYQRAVDRLATRPAKDVLAELVATVKQPPLTVYTSIVRYPALAPLIAEIPTTEARTKPNMRKVMYSPSHDLFAIPVKEHSPWEKLSVQIVDANGKTVAYLSDVITQSDATDEPFEIDSNAEWLLTQLGFHPTKVEKPSDAGLVVGRKKVSRDGVKVRTLPDLGDLVSSTKYIPEGHLLVRFYTVEEMECGGFEDASVDVVKVP
ncbi:MAG: hypothetical protein QM831_41995 [Kofleriaceae bacterium]